MARIDRFEDLKCWQGARELVRLVYSICEEDRLARDFEIRNQIRGAALSSMNNIAEGFGRHSNAEFIRFLDISQSSSMEVMSITYALEDLKYSSGERISEVRKRAEETRGLTLGLIKYLKSKRPPNIKPGT